MRVYDHDKVPKCQWEGCKFDAMSQVYNADCTENIFVCRAHRGVVEINLEMSGKLRLNQSSNVQSEARPGPKPDDAGPRPVSDPIDWEKEAALKADGAAVPIEGEEEEKSTRAIISDIPKPRKTQ